MRESLHDDSRAKSRNRRTDDPVDVQDGIDDGHVVITVDEVARR
ncbi:MAG: hypothetical protein P8Z31_08680 [Gammaproteobacteria bacterium]